MKGLTPTLEMLRNEMRHALERSMPEDAHPDHHSVTGGIVFFYGGPFSNFVADKPLEITSDQPWQDLPYTSSYATVEHFFQASKATTRKEHDAINQARSPGESKLLGQVVKLREDWEEVKFAVMLTGLREKFQDPRFREDLIVTAGRYIAEDSPTDDQWGIRNKDGKGWSGLNLLGLALMQVRAEILDRIDSTT